MVELAALAPTPLSERLINVSTLNLHLDIAKGEWHIPLAKEPCFFSWVLLRLMTGSIFGCHELGLQQ